MDDQPALTYPERPLAEMTIAQLLTFIAHALEATSLDSDQASELAEEVRARAAAEELVSNAPEEVRPGSPRPAAPDAAGIKKSIQRYSEHLTYTRTMLRVALDSVAAHLQAIAFDEDALLAYNAELQRIPARTGGAGRKKSPGKRMAL